MILTELTLTDFGVFRGRQTIKLLPQRGKPIVLIGGKNGAGKTTLLEAIKLCFYGAHGLGCRSKDDYLKYLDGRIHSNPSAIVQPTVASVAVEFRYSDVDAVHTYKVTRSWERRNTNKIQESLSIDRDGRPLDEVSSEHWQDFVRDLIPPGVAQLFFFDGEKIQHLADDSSDHRELAEAVKALLGLDIVERLETDLDIYRSRAIKSLRDVAGGEEVAELEQGLQHLQRTLAELRATREVQEASTAELRLGISRLQDKITSQGGSFARNRDKLIHERAVLETRITQLEDVVRGMCGGLLPFTLVPELCGQLKTQLLKEQTATDVDSEQKLLGSAQRQIVARVEHPMFWDGLPQLPTDIRAEVNQRLEKMLREVLTIGDSDRVACVHELSPTLMRQLIAWLDAAADLKEPLSQHGADLERLHGELHRVEGELRKVPADELLKPLLGELQRLNHELAEAGKAALLTHEKIKTIELEISTLQRTYNHAVEKLAAQAKHGSEVQLVPKIKTVLDEFKSALLCKKLLQLQNVVTNSFNALCRKKGSVLGITISPEDFSVTFKGKDHRPIPKSQLSAGEKQIYAISMLWGLAKTSGRPLPIVIDTPLGRLDTDHRRLLTEHYFPFASHQVVILSTDSEIDQVYFRDLSRRTSHAYLLDFSMKEHGTTLNSGYFWNETN